MITRSCTVDNLHTRTKIVPTIESLENVFQTTEDLLATKVQNQLQISEGREALRAGNGLIEGSKYIEAVLRRTQDKKSGIDQAITYTRMG